MRGVLTGFVDELRAAGVPVSMVEAIDAAKGLEHVDLGSRAAVRSVLGATLVKSVRHRATFDSTFDAFFAAIGAAPGTAEDEAVTAAAAALLSGAGGAGAGSGDGEAVDLVAALRRAIGEDDPTLAAAIARYAVDRHAGIEAGRPVGGAYYLYRVMRRLDVDGVERGLVEAARRGEETAIARRLAVEEVGRRLEEFRRLVRDEIRRRLARDRGGAALARSLRRPLIEDVDLTAATRDELVEIERIIHPLGRRLATRISQRRARGDRGRLDVRRTMRASLSTGGTPVEPRFRRRRPGKPEIVVLCDVSGSVASFARFTLQLVYAIASQFSRVRVFAFIDGIDEVTAMLGPGADFGSAMRRVASEARVVSLDGHSDYGAVFRAFAAAHLDDAVTPRSTVLVTGDARNNYHDPAAGAFGAIADRARSVMWLNPEPARYWNTGDSAMGAYAEQCDRVAEIRTLRHLERFVESVVARPR